MDKSLSLLYHSLFRSYSIFDNLALYFFVGGEISAKTPQVWRLIFVRLESFSNSFRVYVFFAEVLNESPFDFLLILLNKIWISFYLFHSQTPEIMDVSFYKGQGGMGLSIVAAKVILFYDYLKHDCKEKKNYKVYVRLVTRYIILTLLPIFMF